MHRAVEQHEISDGSVSVDSFRATVFRTTRRASYGVVPRSHNCGYLKLFLGVLTRASACGYGFWRPVANIPIRVTFS